MRSTIDVASLIFILKFSKNKFASWLNEYILCLGKILYQSKAYLTNVIGNIYSINASSFSPASNLTQTNEMIKTLI